VAQGKTNSGYEFDSARLDRVERRFWRDIWDSVPSAVAAERGIEIHAAGSVQATAVAALAEVSMLNLVLGADEPCAVARGYLEEALAWIEARGARPYVPVSPGPEAVAAEGLLEARGYRRGYGWMKFVRDAHPPRFRAPEVEVVELTAPDEEPFGAIAAAGFGLPAWGGDFFAHLPGRPGWRCYVARVDGEAQACGALLIEGEVAEFGIGATLEPARGRGCQLALLHRRIADAAAAGCRTLFVETGERAPDRPATSYRNILRAGFEEAYPRPNWVHSG
jgi:GNAT superfamily N-acetyltransferase